MVRVRRAVAEAPGRERRCRHCAEPGARLAVSVARGAVLLRAAPRQPVVRDRQRRARGRTCAGLRPLAFVPAAPGSRASSRSSITTSRITSSGSRRATFRIHFPVVRNIEADSVLTGIEAHGDVKLTNEITAEVTYDMVRGELKDSGDPLPRIPPQRLLAGLTIRRTRSRSAAAPRLCPIRIACSARSCRPKAM